MRRSPSWRDDARARHASTIVTRPIRVVSEGTLAAFSCARASPTLSRCPAWSRAERGDAAGWDGPADGKGTCIVRHAAATSTLTAVATTHMALRNRMEGFILVANARLGQAIPAEVGA
jgi:hypothetical protein